MPPSPVRPRNPSRFLLRGATAGLVLSFAVNGAWLGRDTTLPASAGPYVLAVQPYMGGVARIVGAVSTA